MSSYYFLNCASAQPSMSLLTMHRCPHQTRLTTQWHTMSVTLLLASFAAKSITAPVPDCISHIPPAPPPPRIPASSGACLHVSDKDRLVSSQTHPGLATHIPVSTISGLHYDYTWATFTVIKPFMYRIGNTKYLQKISIWKSNPSKYETLNQCCFDVGLTSNGSSLLGLVKIT